MTCSCCRGRLHFGPGKTDLGRRRAKHLGPLHGPGAQVTKVRELHRRGGGLAVPPSFMHPTAGLGASALCQKLG